MALSWITEPVDPNEVNVGVDLAVSAEVGGVKDFSGAIDRYSGRPSGLQIIPSDFDVSFDTFLETDITSNSYVLNYRGNEIAVIAGYAGTNVVECFGRSSGDDIRTGTQMTIPTGAWVNIRYTYDGTDQKGYINGVEQFSIAKSITIDSMSDNHVVIGASKSDGSDSYNKWLKNVTIGTYTTPMHLWVNNQTSGTVLYDQIGSINPAYSNNSWGTSAGVEYTLTKDGVEIDTSTTNPYSFTKTAELTDSSANWNLKAVSGGEELNSAFVVDVKSLSWITEPIDPNEVNIGDELVVSAEVGGIPQWSFDDYAPYVGGVISQTEYELVKNGDVDGSNVNSVPSEIIFTTTIGSQVDLVRFYSNDLGGSVFGVRFHAPENSVYFANNGVLDDSNYSQSMPIATGSKLYFKFTLDFVNLTYDVTLWDVNNPSNVLVGTYALPVGSTPTTLVRLIVNDEGTNYSQTTTTIELNEVTYTLTKDAVEVDTSTTNPYSFTKTAELTDSSANWNLKAVSGGEELNSPFEVIVSEAGYYTDNARLKQIIAKVQGTIGTYVIPDYETDQNVEVYNLTSGNSDFNHTGGEDLADGTPAMGRSYSQQKTHDRTFQVDMKPASDIAVAPKWWKFLQGCGFSIDTTGANALALWGAGNGGCTTLDIDLPQWACEGAGGTAFVMSSAMGSFEITWGNSGSPVMPTFTFVGKYGGYKTLEESAYFAPSGMDTTDCTSFLGSGITFGGYLHNVWAGSLLFSADSLPVENSDDVTNNIETGISHIQNKDVSIQLSLTVQRVKKGDYNYESDIVNNTMIGDTVMAFEGFELTCGNCQLIDWQPSETSETGTFNITMEVRTIEFKQVV